MKIPPSLYKLLLFTFSALFVISCTKDPDSSPGTRPPQKIKKRVLTSYSGDDYGGVYASLQYDSTGRLQRFGSQLDPQWKVFWANDTIRRVMSPVTTDNGLFMRDSWIFIYDQNKRCSQVFRKHANNYDGSVMIDSNPWFDNINDGNAVLMDSLVYTPSGQVSEIWYYAGPGVRQLARYEYNTPSDPAPKTIHDYRGIPIDLSNFTYFSKTNFQYTNQDQPAYNTLWFLGLMNIWVPTTPEAFGVDSYFFCVLLKKCVKQFEVPFSGGSPYSISPVFIYKYNADSTVFDGTHDPDNFLLYRMQMKFAIKEF